MFAPHRYRNATSQVSDPNFENVSLLLHGDGTNGAQNNTFLDSSTNNFTITRNGTPTQGSFSPYGNSWSNYFDGSSSLVSTKSSSLNFGSGNLTIEGWINPLPMSSGAYYCIFSFGGPIQIYIRNSTIEVYFNDSDDAESYIVNGLTGPSNSILANTWNHFAVVRNGTTFTVYVNGIAGTPATGVTQSIFYSSASPRIGRYNATQFPYFGNISNLRIVNGTALYTSNFTPPTSNLTAVAGTSLLTCQSNRFIDNSSNNFTITASGTPSVQPNSPFNPTSEYSITANGGSGYFDGSGDYLSFNGIVFNGNFCAEAWVYRVQNSTSYSVIFGGSGITGVNNHQFAINNNGEVGLVLANTIIINSIGTAALNNQWNHIAWVRSGSNCAIFVNGVRQGTGTSSINTSVCSRVAAITTGDSQYSLNGYISNARIVIGNSVYNPAQTTISVPTSPLTAIANTSLLCNFTNAGIFDNASKNNLLTVGNARVSTAQKKYGSGSMLFNGSTDYCRTIAPAGTHQFGTGDFTIECWAYCTNLAGGTSNVMEIIDFRSSTINEARPTLAIQNSQFLYYANGSNRIVSSTISANTWYHVAVVRSSGSTKLYVNGTNVGVTYADTNNYLDGTPTIGNYLPNPVFGFAGYIDDVRITKGIARYTANFTPPTQAFPNL